MRRAGFTGSGFRASPYGPGFGVQTKLGLRVYKGWMDDFCGPLQEVSRCRTTEGSGFRVQGLTTRRARV